MLRDGVPRREAAEAFFSVKLKEANKMGLQITIVIVGFSSSNSRKIGCHAAPFAH